VRFALNLSQPHHGSQKSYTAEYDFGKISSLQIAMLFSSLTRHVGSDEGRLNE
jgi:hypothetical protein